MLRGFYLAVTVCVQVCGSAGQWRIRGRQLEIGRKVLVTNKLRSIVEDRATRCMIPVMMAIGDIAHRNTESRVDLGFEPLGEIRIDCVAENDTIIRYQKNRVMVVIRRPVQILADLNDRSGRRLLRRRNAG